MEYIDTFKEFDFLYMTDLQSEYTKFMATNPSLEAFENELKKYMAIEEHIQSIAPVHNIGAMSLETQPIKNSLKAEAAAWKTQFAKNLHKQGKEQLHAIHDYMRETTLKLNRKIEDLEDVRTVDGCAQGDSRSRERDRLHHGAHRGDLRPPRPVQGARAEGGDGDCFRASLRMDQDEDPRAGRQRQPQSTAGWFQARAHREVKAFVVDAVEFRADWDANGPAVPGLDPMEAVDRLKKFTQMFEVRARKWRNYCSGEELFGLSVTQYPEMEKTEKEISMLTRLYDLYTDVLTTMDGLRRYPLGGRQANIEGMSEQVSGFQAQCKKLQGAPRLARVHRLSQEDRRLPRDSAASPGAVVAGHARSPLGRTRAHHRGGIQPRGGYLQAAGSSRGEYAQSIRRYRGPVRWRRQGGAGGGKLAVIDEDWAEQSSSLHRTKTAAR